MIWIDISYTEGARFCFTIPTEKITEESNVHHFESVIKNIEKRGILITKDKKHDRGYVSHLMKCYKLDVPVLTIHEFDIDNAPFTPEIIIYDFPEINNEYLQHISNTARAFPVAEIIKVTEDNNSEAIEMLKASGCTLVLTVPVNYHMLMTHLHKLFTQQPKAQSQIQT
jgi:hypothetical protein